MSEPRTQQTNVSDAQIRAMLDAFAGSASPIRSQIRSRRRATRRTFILLAAGLLALGLAVPGSLALLGNHSETPKQFLRDRSQPPNAKRVIRMMLSMPAFKGRVTSIESVVTAHTPDGEVRVYDLRLTHNESGTAVILSRLGGTGTAAFGGGNPTLACPRGWALRAGAGGVDRPGKSFAYIAGRVSPKVASVHVLYRNGTTTPSAVGNGYFLSWIKPRAYYSNVTLIADNAAGTEVGRLRAGGSGGIPHRPGVPDNQQSCG